MKCSSAVEVKQQVRTTANTPVSKDHIASRDVDLYLPATPVNPARQRAAVPLAGSALAALMAAAALPQGAQATSRPECQANFISPNTSAKYAIIAGCFTTNGYIDRFVEHCGAKKAGFDYASFWHIVKLASTGRLVRDSDSVASADTGFESCVKDQFKGQSSRNGMIAGIVVGSVVGVVAIVLLTVYLCRYFGNRGSNNSRSVELPAANG